jgi:ornithine carbamoyltransferase
MQKASRSLLVAKRCLSSTAASAGHKPRSLLSLADLSVAEIQNLLQLSHALKRASKAGERLEQSLSNKTVALMFSKRSTRTRVASESATAALGGHPMFLGASDIQLGVNESLLDTSKVNFAFIESSRCRRYSRRWSAPWSTALWPA